MFGYTLYVSLLCKLSCIINSISQNVRIVDHGQVFKIAANAAWIYVLIYYSSFHSISDALLIMSRYVN